MGRAQPPLFGCYLRAKTALHISLGIISLHSLNDPVRCYPHRVNAEIEASRVNDLPKVAPCPRYSVVDLRLGKLSFILSP